MNILHRLCGMHYYRAIAFSLTLLALTACGGGAGAVIGVWNNYDNYQFATERWEFFKDKTCSIESDGTRLAGTWTTLEDNRIRITLPASGGHSTMMFATVNGDDLVIDTGDRSTTKYVRDGSQASESIRASILKAVEEREVAIEAEKRAVAEKLASDERDRRAQIEAERLASAERAEEQRVAREKEQEGRRAYETGKDAQKRGFYPEAVASFEKAIELGNASALNTLAWHYATCRDHQQLNAEKSLELALEATKRNPDDHSWLDTLAAAYARNGQFDDAVKAQLRALSLNSQREYEERLQLYRQGKAFQEP